MHTDAFKNKHHVARRITYLSIQVNLTLSIVQILTGVFAQSQALIADGFHSFSDLLGDAIILLVNQHSHNQPDADHNYGHSRYETVATLLVGLILIVTGILMLWRALVRMSTINQAPPIHIIALAMAILILISKEVLFRYMLKQAQRVRSTMLVTNAWHARADAASSLIVLCGIAGSILGAPLLDPLAATIVGIMIGKIGWTFAWNALQDLSDRALDRSTSDQIRTLLMATPGVVDVHALRTRKTGDMALVDAHILVDPMISVSEGHYIAENARQHVLTDERVLDALIHVDPENDISHPAPLASPTRSELTERLARVLKADGMRLDSVTIHYLSHGIELDVVVAAPEATQPLDSGQLSQAMGVYAVRLSRRIQ